MAFQIKKATKLQAKLRMAMFGPSGGGKTMSSLRIAKGLLHGTDKRIGLIDTERGSASKYSDRFDFDVIELGEKKDIATVTGAINAFADAGHGVLIIDSLSHAWQELLAEVDRLAKTRFKGNTWSAWSEGTPLQRKLVDAILDYPGHVIATMRSKTEWTTETNDGKSKPVRVGLAPEQGKGIEYEFDVLLELSTSHVGEFIKDRTGRFQDVTVEKPGEDLGRELAAWLAEGAAVPERSAAPAPQAPPPPPAAVSGGVLPAQVRAISELARRHELERDHARGFIAWVVGNPDLKSVMGLDEEEAALVLRMDWPEQLAAYAVHLVGGPPDPDPDPPAPAVEAAQELLPASKQGARGGGRGARRG